MQQILKAGLLYSIIVFVTGLGIEPIRIMWAVPRFGSMVAQLMEAPIMLVVIVLAARWTVRRLELPRTPSIRIGTGLIALWLLILAEYTVVLTIPGLSIGEYLASRDPVSATVYIVMLGLFAFMPLILSWR